MAKKKNKAPKIWPGMPTKRSQMFESLVLLYPVVIVILVAVLAFVMSLFR